MFSAFSTNPTEAHGLGNGNGYFIKTVGVNGVNPDQINLTHPSVIMNKNLFSFFLFYLFLSEDRIYTKFNSGRAGSPTFSLRPDEEIFLLFFSSRTSPSSPATSVAQASRMSKGHRDKIFSLSLFFFSVVSSISRRH